MIKPVQHLAESEKEGGRVPPLEPGDHLDQKTFHERYEAMPKGTRAELIGGVVYMPSPTRRLHGRFHGRIVHWLIDYEDATPGTGVLANASTILGRASEPQPDACLLISPPHGQTRDENDYIVGAPELIAEVGSSTESIDLNERKADYESAGVREYLVVALRKKRVYWFVLARGKFKELNAGPDGILRSKTFPGLWLDPAALLRKDTQRLREVLNLGLASPEHAAFVAKLSK